MSTYLAYTRVSRPTGRVIARELGLSSYGVKTPREPPEVLIRWGSRRPMGQPSFVLNKARSIALASDKVMALEIMRDAGLPHVPFFQTWEDAIDYCGGYGYVLGRTRTGMMGRGITVYDPAGQSGDLYAKEPALTHEWYSVYMKPTREVRLHVVGKEVVRIQGKFLDFPEQALENPFVQNYAGGYRFRTPRKELNSSRKNSAIEAVEALSLDFGAVDMLLFGNREEGKILEINTAPACSPLTASAYAGALSNLISES